ncbi:MAG: hypothetical protein QXW05_06280 [Ignisphaera sp.]
MISRKIIIVLSLLILVSPIFGIVLPEILESEEYMESLADIVNATGLIYSPFREYMVPGLDAYLGYMVSAAFGSLIIISIYYIILYIMRRKS